jgi:hypothetical protein
MEENNNNLENQEPIQTETPVVEQPVEVPVQEAAPVVPEVPVQEAPVEPAVEQSVPEQPVPVPEVPPTQETTAPVGVAPEAPKKKRKGGLILVLLAVLALGGFATWYFALGGDKVLSGKKDEPAQEENKEEQKEDKKEEDVTPKEDDNKEQTVYTSKYDGSDAEIYDAIQAEKDYVSLTDITGTDDNIVIKSLLFLTQRYSHAIKSTQTVTRDMTVDKCVNLRYFNIDTTNFNKDVVCLANLDFSITYLKNANPDDHTNPPGAYLTTEEGKTKLLEYYPNAKVQTLKEVCGDKYTSTESEDSIVAYTGMTTNINEKSFDLTSIVKTGSNYKATITSYRKYKTRKSPEETSYEVVDKETFVFNVTVKNNHIVFGTVE